MGDKPISQARLISFPNLTNPPIKKNKQGNSCIGGPELRANQLSWEKWNPSAKNRRFSMSTGPRFLPTLARNLGPRCVRATFLHHAEVIETCFLNKVQVKDSWIILMFHGSETSWTLSDIVPTHCWLSPLPNQCLYTYPRLPPMSPSQFHGHLRDPITPLCQLFFFSTTKGLNKGLKWVDDGGFHNPFV